MGSECHLEGSECYLVGSEWHLEGSECYLVGMERYLVDSSVFIFSGRLRSETAILGKLYLKHFQKHTSLPPKRVFLPGSH